MTQAARWSRREFLAFGWFPFFWRPRHISLAGARFCIIRHGRSSRRYLFIHGNEETSREVLTRHMKTYHGVAYLIEGHTRNVPIDSGEIDPNRMFSRVGAEANLKELNPKWTPEQIRHALDELDRGRPRLVRALFPPGRGLLVALHNNSEDYSLADEKPISDAISIRDPGNLHAFFLCTDPNDYKILASSPYNALLQQHGPKEDDGSLSRLATARGVRYVNLEVRNGDLERQLTMLSWLEQHLP
ncbi:MAG TPA: hypothetical protein VG675_21095 [Bryobacteraceae bacterium]|nr:hypothetical protein [Bryobacteraceae bacterium]